MEGLSVAPMSWWTHPCVTSYFLMWTGLSILFCSIGDCIVTQVTSKIWLSAVSKLLFSLSCSLCLPFCLPFCLSSPALYLVPCYLWRSIGPITWGNHETEENSELQSRLNLYTTLQWGQILSFIHSPVNLLGDTTEPSSWATFYSWSQKPEVINVCCLSHQVWEMLSPSNRTLIQSSHT